MDIKWKNLMRRWYIRLVAYGVIVICAVTFLTGFVKSLKGNDYDNLYDVLAHKDFTQSNYFTNDLYEYANSFYTANVKYENIDEIKAGTYAKEPVDEYLQSMYEEWISYDQKPTLKLEISHSGDISWYYVHNQFSYESVEDTSSVSQETRIQEVEVTEVVGDQVKAPTQEVNLNEDKSVESFFKAHPNLKEQLTQGVIKGQLYEYKNVLRNLSNKKELTGKRIKNKAELQTWSKQFVTLHGYYRSEYESFHSSQEDIKDVEYISQEFLEGGEGDFVIVGMSKEAYEAKQKEWDQLFKKYETKMKDFIIAFVIAGLMFVYLAWATGYRKDKESVHLYKFDELWSEVQLVGLGAAGIGIIGLLNELLNEGSDIMLNLIIVGMISLMILILMILLSQVRKIKTHSFMKGFIILRIGRKGMKVVLSLWRNGSLTKRALILAIVLPLICATWIGVPFVIAFLIYLLHKHLKNFLLICKGTDRIRNGELNYKIETTETQGHLYQLTQDINQISQGLEHAISSELKSERLKTELISNVSHDIKTPLTSIISYVDLLKKEEFESEKVKEYIEIIDRKAARLSILTNDLFDAAKATSGDMPVQLERVNLISIINQALGEYEEKLTQGEFIIKMNVPEEPAYVMVDGRLIWRVIANLLSNVVKYAQTGSRVYLDVYEEKEQGMYYFTMKNISAYELNIPAEELMERFKRADLSRNTEGSGLGLSIANSLVVLQGGEFNIMVDGDLFKAIIKFQKSFS